MTSNEPQQPTTDQTATTPTAGTAAPNTTSLSQRPQYRSSFGSGMYGSSMYGSSMYGGGMYGRSMYGGMGGMGMGGMGMGANNPQNGFRQEYQGFFQGLRAVISTGFSAFGLFSYGKIFTGMMIKIVKTVFRKSTDGAKKLIAWGFFNRVTTKVMNGFVRSVKGGGSEVEMVNLFFKGLLGIGLAGLAVVYFLIRKNGVDENEAMIRRNMKRRRKARERRLKEMEDCKVVLLTLRL